MKLLVDQNISHRIIPSLIYDFPDVHHVKDHGLFDADDYEIFMFARKNNYEAIITSDDDFVKLLNIFSSPPKIIWIRTGNCSTRYLSELLISKSQSISEFLESEDYFLYELFRSS